MITHKEHFHGSDLEKIEKIYGIKKENIVSFSANVNPLGLSPKLKSTLADCLDVITTYPDREYTDLRKAIGTYCNADYKNILVGNGSTELISAVIRLKNPKTACLVAPTYSEYEREINLCGGTCVYYQLNPEDNFAFHTDTLFALLEQSGSTLLVLCNPNNPTSTALRTDALSEILTFCKENDIFVMIDETYVEFAKEYDSITAVSLLEKYDNFIILRGISKFFASPGLRLGYGLTGNKSLIGQINETKNPWTINSLAEAATKILLTDEDYICRTKQLIFSEREKVCNTLRSIAGLKVYEPTANFVLVKVEKADVDADMLFDAAIQKGLMIRNCSSFEGLDNTFFRVCFMHPEDNERLLACITKCME